MVRLIQICGLIGLIVGIINLFDYHPNDLLGMGVSNSSESITIFLCGDVMLGRGIDQILQHPSGKMH